MKGSITVFACLLLATIILFNCVLVDTAKVISLKSDMKRRSELALNSVLAGFDSLLREQYGIFALNGEKNIKEDFLSYFNVKGLSYGNLGIGIKSDEEYPAIDILNYDLDKVIIELSEGIIETEVFKNQIIDEMKIRTPINIGTTILDKIKVLCGANEMSEAYKKQAEIAKLMNDVNDAIDVLKIYVHGYYDGDITCINGYDKFQRHMTYVSLLKAGVDIVKAGDCEGKEFKKAVRDMKDAVLNMKIHASMYLEYNVKSIEQINIISGVQKNTTNKIKELEKWLSGYEVEDELDLYYKQIIGQQKDELKNKVLLMGNKHLNVSLNKNAGILSNIIQAADNLLRVLDMPQELVLSFSTLEGYIRDLDNKGISIDLKVYTGYEAFDKTYNQFDNRRNAENDLKDFLKEYKTVNIPTELYKTLPSINRGASETGLENEAIKNIDSAVSLSTMSIIMNIMSISDSLKKFGDDPALYMLEGALIDDYIMSYFGNTVNGIESRSGFFNSEVEYIIAGTSSESTNRLICQAIMLSIRFYMNIIHVMCDMDKVELATNIGNAIAGTISLGIGGPLYAMLVIAGWAICESVVDVNYLLDNKEVPLLKRKSDWKLSIDGLTNTVLDDDIDSDAFFNMKYEDYLRILLAFTGQETKLYRLYDLIEINIGDFLNHRFSLSNYFTKIQADITINTDMFSLAILPDPKRKGKKFLITEVCYASY